MSSKLKVQPKKLSSEKDLDGWDVLNNTIQAVLNKLMSGRWIATVIIASSFAYLASSGQIDQKDVVLVVMTVISFYFGKSQSQKK